MTFEFTETENLIVKGLEAAVAEKGTDYIYPPAIKKEACHYLEYDTGRLTGTPTGPGCIVGHALLNSGLMTTDELATYEGSAANMAAGALVREEIAEALREAQEAQDCGETWGAARDRFYQSLNQE